MKRITCALWLVAGSSLCGIPSRLPADEPPRLPEQYAEVVLAVEGMT